MTLVAPLLLTGGLAANAQGPDVTAPVLTEYAVTSVDGDDDLAYFIDEEPATFNIRLHVTDESGLGDPYVIVSAGSQTTSQSLGLQFINRVSGDAKDGWYEGTLTIPNGKAPGDWRIITSTLTDTIGNSNGTFTELGMVTIVYGNPVTPDAATFDDEADAYTIPSVEGVEYLVDGEVIAAGTYPANGEVTVTARALDGYVIDGEDSWSHTFVAVNVTAGPVKFQDEDGSSADTYTIPSTTGVEYQVNGESVEAGTYAATGEVTVTARALGGYVIDGKDSWSHTFDSTTAVTTQDVSFTDNSGTARDTYTVPSVKGVEYLVGGKVVQAGTHAGSGTVEITARALDGFSLSGTSTWSKTFTAATPFIDVKPGVEHYDAMMWMYDEGVSTGWRTNSGPEYRALSPVNRDAMAAFLYRQAGSPDVDLPATSPFTDMRPGQEHYEAVIWAYQEGITMGWEMPNGTHQFRPVEPIARDAMAAFLYRFAGGPAFNQPDAKCFTDVANGMMFAKEMCWMKSTGISTGWSDGTYRPLEPVKRDAMAAFLQRYDAKF